MAILPLGKCNLQFIALGSGRGKYGQRSKASDKHQKNNYAFPDQTQIRCQTDGQADCGKCGDRFKQEWFPGAPSR